MQKPKLRQVPPSKTPPTSKAKVPLTVAPRVGYSASTTAPAEIAYQIHLPEPGVTPMLDRAYILINVQPGQTSAVVKALSDIKEILTIDPCWGKPDIITVVEVSDQDALTQLVLSRIHSIEGVTQTDTHLVYKLAESPTR
ncbi:MAG: Lrp/AsnC ligand binding domain-containing protein [Nitrospira sp.]|nr:Lrp/AsnC ligand binding domain-containing protein [Nitrospira sp.]